MFGQINSIRMFLTSTLLILTLRGGVHSDHVIPLQVGDQSIEMHYSINDSGCFMHDLQWRLYSTFRLEELDHCISYLCTKDMIIVLEDSSGCYDGEMCRYSPWTRGCNTYSCTITGRTHTRTDRIHVTKEISFSESERCQIYSQEGCYRLQQWHYFKGKRCFCESSSKVRCENIGPAFMGPGIMNHYE